MDVPAEPGTIADVVARLRLWCSRSDHGFIRITFDDGAARDEVIRLFRQHLGPDTVFHAISLPPAATPQIMAERLADELSRLGPGIVSIEGFEVSLPPTGSAMAEALRALNARRETFIHPGQHTLWWFPRHVAEALTRQHHDLNSWFLKRTELTETIDTPEDRNITEQGHEASRLRDAAKHDAAETVVREILTQEELRLGPNHPRVASALNNLASILQATNRLSESEPLIRRALAIDEDIYGPHHPLVAIRLNNLASLLQATNHQKESEKLMRRALAIEENAYGPEHPSVAAYLNNLGQLLHVTNRFSEAEPLLKRALAIDEKNYGSDHPNVARDLYNLARLFQDTDRLKESESLTKRALKIYEKTYGPDHPSVALGLNNLAGVYHDSQRFSEAEPLMRRALAIDEKFYGPDHPKVATHLSNLGLLIGGMGRLDEAEPLYRRALAIDESSYGPYHPSIARDLNNLASLLIYTNRLAEAEPLMRRSVKIKLNFRAKAGHNHFNHKSIVNNYVECLQRTGLSEDQIMQRLQEIGEEVERESRVKLEVTDTVNQD